ncbi:MAG: 50S ribosomal protein L16 [archaeon]
MAERRGGIYARFDGRPNTRTSQRKPRKGYVKGIPGMRIHHFHTGNRKGVFNMEYSLIPEDNVQLKHSALEAARIGAGKTLSTKLGDSNYHLLIRTYPHHILRENSMATGAGADRFSSGMSKSFGRPVGRAARVHRGQKIMSLFVPKDSEEVAKDALRRANMKLPVRCSMKIEKVLEE